MSEVHFEIILNNTKIGDSLKLITPFQFEFHGDDFSPELYLDYRIDTCNRKGNFNFDSEEMSLFKVHRFYDTIVSITTK